MSVLMIDCETYSACDLRACGSYKYARHPSTEVTLWSVRDPGWDNSLVFENASLWDVLVKLKSAGRIEWTRNKTLTLVHWAAFDRLLTQFAEPDHPYDASEWNDRTPDAGIEGPNNTLWCDLREISLTYGGPGNLKNASIFWGASQETKSEGGALIRRFCIPQEDGTRFMPEEDPVRWEEFRAYARQDTATMLPIYFRLLALEDGHGHWEHWEHLRTIGRMNERGVHVDVPSAIKAKAEMEVLENELVGDCEREFGFSPNQVKKVAEFLELENCQRETLENFVDTSTDVDKIRVANARLVTSGAARKKLDPMIGMAQEDGRVRGCFDYHGAWTRRLTSWGVQFQNMVRSASDGGFFDSLTEREWDTEIFEAVRRNIRGFVSAAPGNVLVAADYAQVELRVGAWLAGETWLLNALASGKDAYRMIASKLYEMPETHINGEQRQFGKIVELGSMYQLGGKGLQRQAAGYGVDLDFGSAKVSIDVYREEHPAIVAAWRDTQNAFIECLQAPVGQEAYLVPGDHERLPGAGVRAVMGPAKTGTTRHACGAKFVRGDYHIKLVRPSGFAQYFWNPRMREGAWPDGGPKMEIEYLRRDRSGKMSPSTTYGGDLFQGLVQGTAADLMLEGMARAEDAGFPPIMSVHDEVVCEVPDQGVDRTEELCKIISILPTWGEGLPITAEGWTGPRFTK